MYKALVALMMVTSQAFGQCNNPSNASETGNGLPAGWAQGTAVQVYLDSTQNSSAEIAAIQAAFSNWQGSPNNSGVTYQFTVMAGPPVPTGNYVIVNRTTPTPNGSPDPSAAANTFYHYTTSGSVNHINNAAIQISPSATNASFLTAVTAHEIGHTMWLGECTSCTWGTEVMASGVPMNSTGGSTAPSPCENTTVDSVSGYSSIGSGGGGGQTGCSPEYDGSGGRCAQWDESGCYCYFYSNTSTPIIIPLAQASQIELTSISEGVWFDLKASGTPIRTAWTAANSNLGLLFLDRNSNGTVDDGSELFGDHTPLPNGQTAKQGFEALAVFDEVAHGGNGDGWIDHRDAVWPDLRLWVDSSHDGISQPNEIFTLEGVNVSTLSTDFISVMRRDAYGNTLRYKAKAIVGGSVRWAHDVFFLTSATYPSAKKGQVLGAPSLRSTVAAFFSPVRGGRSCNLTLLAR